MPPLGSSFFEITPGRNRQAERVRRLESVSVNIAQLLDRSSRKQYRRAVMRHLFTVNYADVGHSKFPTVDGFYPETWYTLDVQLVHAIYKPGEGLFIQSMDGTDNEPVQRAEFNSRDYAGTHRVIPYSERQRPIDIECLSLAEREKFATDVLDTMYLIGHNYLPAHKLPDPADWNPALAAPASFSSN